ncbi:MAG: hypothetical protein JXM70_03530, partial [Pirellulales bacterium]|nr:hypothetical protein [Pirellulales bacterium]
ALTAFFQADADDKRKETRPQRIPVFLNWDYNCLTLGPEGLAELVADAKWAGVDGINIRISNKGALNRRTAAGTTYHERLDAFGADYDPLANLVRECRKQGIQSTVWVDLFEAAYDRLIHTHPEFSPRGRSGKPRLSGFPCYSHEEVRRHMLELVDEMARYKPDNVFFCTKSSHIPKNHLNQPHNRDSGFNRPVVDCYRELYGIDILKQPFDQKKMGLIRGEFVIDFLVEAKRRLNSRGIRTIAGATVSGRLQPAGPNLLLDWRRMVERHAADAILMANSRGEYYAFYDSKGRKKFQEIKTACERADMDFYAYIISSGTHQPISKKVGFAGLLDYLPSQIAYLHELGADAVLIHDLDLYSLDRNLRRALWRAAGRRPSLDKILSGKSNTDKETIETPTPKSLEKLFPSGVPQGRFEDGNSDFWYLVSCWTNDLGLPTANCSFECSAARKHPIGWKPAKTENPKLQAVYDWKVMHDHPESGRTYHGRSSVMLAAEPGAGKNSNRTIAWESWIDVPKIPLEKQIIRVQAHGEDLAGIAAAGMTVDFLDAQGKPRDTRTVTCPTAGTFSWQPLVLSRQFDPNTQKLHVKLFLTAAETKDNTGRLWFDSFEIVPALPVDQTDLRVVETDGGCLRLKARPGVELACVPFRVDSKNLPEKLRLRLRADCPLKVTLKWRGGKNADKTVEVGKKWGCFEMPLTLKEAVGAARVIISPRGTSTLLIDDVELQ